MTDGKVHTVRKRFDSKTMSMKAEIIESPEALLDEALTEAEANAPEVAAVDDTPTSETVTDEAPAATKKPAAAKGKNARKKLAKLVGKKNDE